MEKRRAGYSIFFVISLCALALGISEGKRRIPETVFTNEGRTTSFLKINEKKVWWFFLLLALISRILGAVMLFMVFICGKNTFEDSCLNWYFGIVMNGIEQICFQFKVERITLNPRQFYYVLVLWRQINLNWKVVQLLKRLCRLLSYVKKCHTLIYKISYFHFCELEADYRQVSCMK